MTSAGMITSSPAPGPLRAAFAAPAPRFFGDPPWLFDRRTDLVVFGAVPVLSLALVLVGSAFGWLDSGAPEWTFFACILAVDVAHVWATLFRVHLDPHERRARRALHLTLPVIVYVVLLAVHLASPAWFWTALAYVAAFHFVRQQVGFVRLYRRRERDVDRLDAWLDELAIHAATVGPLLVWHARLPRQFEWFVAGDFARIVPPWVAPWTMIGSGLGLAAFTAHQLTRRIRRRPLSVGKLLVVYGSFATWWIGIVALDSDYAFTVTNVLPHGVPYFVLTYRYARARAPYDVGGARRAVLARGAIAFVLFLVTLAFLEETLWDRWVWRERGWLFGEAAPLDAVALTFLVPLLALPQAVHYVLDGVVWRRHTLPRADAPASSRERPV